MSAQRNGSSPPPWDLGLHLGTGKGRFIRRSGAKVQCLDPRAVATYCIEALFGETDDLEQEELWVLLLNTKNQITHEVLLYRGTQNNCVVRIAELFREAVRLNAAAIIVAHCHPSGNPAPSPEDIHVTRQAREAGKLLDVDVLDHIVFGHDAWVSMRERGLGFT